MKRLAVAVVLTGRARLGVYVTAAAVIAGLDLPGEAGELEGPARRLPLDVGVWLYHRACAQGGDDDEDPGDGHSLAVPGAPHGDM